MRDAIQLLVVAGGLLLARSASGDSIPSAPVSDDELIEVFTSNVPNALEEKAEELARVNESPVKEEPPFACVARAERGELRIEYATVGCFGGVWGNFVRIMIQNGVPQIEGRVGWAVLPRERLADREREQIVAALAQVLQADEPSHLGRSTTRVPVEISWRCEDVARPIVEGSLHLEESYLPEPPKPRAFSHWRPLFANRAVNAAYLVESILAQHGTEW